MNDLYMYITNDFSMYCLHVLKATVSVQALDQFTSISLVLSLSSTEIFSTVFCDCETKF